MVSKGAPSVSPVLSIVNSAAEVSANATPAAVNSVKSATEAFEVSSHIRNLAQGHMASELKIATAAAEGSELGPGQTWVASYMKGVFPA